MSLIKQGISVSISKILFYILGFIFSFIIARSYGPEAYGSYVLLYSIVSIVITIVPLGSKDGLMFLIPSMTQSKDKETIKGVVSISAFMALSAACVIWIVLIVFETNILSFFNYQSTDVNVFRWFCSIILFEGLSHVLSGALRGYGDFKYFSIGIFIVNLFRIILIGLMLLLNFKNNPIELTYCAAAFLALLLYIYGCFKIDGFGKITKIALNNYLNMLRMFFPMVITSLILIVQSRLDRFIIGYYQDLSQLGIYSIALTIAGLSSFFLVVLNSVIAPRISKLFAVQDMQKLQHIYNVSVKWLSYANFIFIGIIVFLGEQLLSIYGQEFHTGYMVLIIISAGQMFNSIAGVSSQVISMIGKPKMLTYFSSLAVILGFVLNILLVPKFGISGAAIATAVSLIIYNILCIYYVDKVLSINPFNIQLFKQVSIGLLILGLCYYLSTLISTHFIFIKVLFLLLFIIVFSYFQVKLFLEKQELTLVKKALKLKH